MTTSFWQTHLQPSRLVRRVGIELALRNNAFEITFTCQMVELIAREFHVIAVQQAFACSRQASFGRSG